MSDEPTRDGEMVDRSEASAPVTTLETQSAGSPKADTVAGPPEQKTGRIRAVAGGVSKAVRIILTPLLWILRPLVFSISKEPGNPKVRFTSFSTLIYLWPIMVVGWVNAALANWAWLDASPAVLGWIWITVVFVVALCVGADVDRNKLIALAAAVMILWLGGSLLNAKMGIPVLSNIYDYFAGMDVRFEPGTARVFSIVTLIMLLIVMIAAWFDGRYEITTREITHRRLLRTSDSLPRAAKRIKRDWRDLAEFLLGLGAGDLIVIDSNKNEVLRIPNVPFLWFFRHDVDHILEVLATTEAEDIAAAEEEEFG
ncbi:MAG: hypothetical protein ACE5F9_01590 [Phycisphaerae bacterium]